MKPFLLSSHSLFIATILGLCWIVLPLQAGETLLLWPDDPKLNAQAGMGKEVEQRGKLMVQGVKTPHLRLLPAPQSSSPTPAILHVPGGGFKRVVTGIHLPMAKWFREQGIRPFMLVYRCPSDKGDPKAAQQDIQRAIRLMRANAKKWNIDPDRIGVIGSSAGGNLSVRASVFADKNLYPPKDATDQLSSKPDFSILLYPAWVGSRSTGQLSNWVKIPAKIGPTMLIAAKDDQHFDSSPPYEKALRTKGAVVESLYFETGGHGFGLREPKAVATWPEACLKWLKANKVLP